MTQSPEDQPPGEWRRFVDDEEAASGLPEPSLDEPISVAMAFLSALDDPVRYRTALVNLTTPESHQAWGDFSEMAQVLSEIEDWGVASMVDEAVGDSDVVYAKVIRGVDQTYEVLEEQVMNVAAIITLVWRPSFGRWMVHAVGDYVKPEDVPHG